MAEENYRQHLTERQCNVLDQFKEKVADVLQPGQGDHFCLRWLRARLFDLKKSEDMLRQSVAWRKKWGADTILHDFESPEVLQKYYPGGWVGWDKADCPVWIYPMGGLDMKGISMSAKKSDIIKHQVTLMERVYAQFREQNKKHGHRVDKAVMIGDLSGFTLKQLFHPGMNILLNFLGMIEANYPETLKYGFVVNGPTIFPILFSVIKPFLHEDTKKKIIVLGRDWKEKLLEHVDADQLPEYWGGSMTDPDGNTKCLSKVKIGGQVPEEYFLKGSQLVDDSKVTKAVIPRAGSLSLEFEVTKPKHIIRWVFWTEHYDLKFGISLKNAVSGNVQVEPPYHVNCHHVPEDGFLLCDQLGTYVVKFDNNYSWVHSKRLSYFIEVTALPDDGSASTSSTGDRSSQGGVSGYSTPPSTPQESPVKQKAETPL